MASKRIRITPRTLSGDEEWTIEATYTGREAYKVSGKDRYRYSFLADDGEPVIILGSMLLDRDMEHVEPGVRLEIHQHKKQATMSGQHVRVYDIYQLEDGGDAEQD